MPYAKPATFEFNLEDVDCPELWVKCKNPHSLNYADQRRAQQAQFILMRVTRQGGRYAPTPEEDFAITAMDEVVRKSLVEWNLPYPDDHEDVAKRGTLIPLTPPRYEADPETGEMKLVADGESDPLGVLPTQVLQCIVQEVGKRLVQPSKSAGNRGNAVLPPGGQPPA